MLQLYLPVFYERGLRKFQGSLNDGTICASRWGRRTSSGARTGRRSLQRGKPSCQCFRPRRTAGGHTALNPDLSLLLARRPNKRTRGCIQRPCAFRSWRLRQPLDVQRWHVLVRKCMGLIQPSACDCNCQRVELAVSRSLNPRRWPQVGGAQAAMGCPGG